MKTFANRDTIKMLTTHYIGSDNVHDFSAMGLNESSIALASQGIGPFFGTEPGAGNGNIKDFAEWWAM